MEMQGSRTLAATQQQAWDALNDPEVLRTCIPGCDKVERTGEDRFAVAMSVKVGPVSAKFNGRIQLADVQPPQSYTLTFDGQGGAAGFGKGTAKVALAPAGTGCELSYTVNAQVGGKLAQVGQRLIDGVARSMAEDFFRRFDQEMQRRHPEPVSAAASAGVVPDPAAAPAPAPTADAPRPTMPAWTWIVVAAVVLGALYWLAR